MTADKSLAERAREIAELVYSQIREDARPGRWLPDNIAMYVERALLSVQREARAEVIEEAAALFDARAEALRGRIAKRATQEWHGDDSALGQAEADAAAIRRLTEPERREP